MAKTKKGKDAMTTDVRPAALIARLREMAADFTNGIHNSDEELATLREAADALAVLAQDLEHQKAETTRAVLRYTARGHEAGVQYVLARLTQLESQWRAYASESYHGTMTEYIDTLQLCADELSAVWRDLQPQQEQEK